MKLYAKIVDEKQKLCDVGVGSNYSFYQSIGMSEMDVEEGYDGKWYLEGYAPEKPQSVINAERITELQNRLNETDWYAVRYAETGVAIPDEIRAERQAAREEISRLRSGGDNG